MNTPRYITITRNNDTTIYTVHSATTQPIHFFIPGLRIFLEENGYKRISTGQHADTLVGTYERTWRD